MADKRWTTSDIARETIRQIAARRVEPTPEMYAQIFAEVAHRVDPAMVAPTLSAADSEHAWAQAEDVQPFYETYKLLQQLLRQMLSLGLLPRLLAYPALHQEALALQRSLEQARKVKEWQTLALPLKQLLLRVEMMGADEHQLRHQLSGLLQLLLENIGELVIDDQWLRGQIHAIQAMLAGSLDSQQLLQAEAALKEVIYKQSLLKHNLLQSREAMKTLMASFIDKMKFMGESSTQYADKIEQYATQLSATDDVLSMQTLMQQLMQDTQSVQLDIVRARGELQSQQQRVNQANAEISALQTELTSLSAVVRIDPLTNVLNRRGMDEALAVEMARWQRQGGHLSVAILDIDHFKSLNDTHGHLVGDAALQHLAGVVRRAIRPTDIVSRMGGEEFVLILPDTMLQDAVEVVTRLQRSLTKEYFLSNNQKLLLTFSAGVAMCRADEPVVALLQRADEAMYQAKQAGRNRVMCERDAPSQ